MALINTLRNKMGKFVVIAISLAILSFVLADLLGPNSSLLGGNDNSVGEIASTSIALDEFQALVQERETSYILNFNRQPTDREKPTIRQQAWDLLITRYAYQKEYDEVGISVTSDEVWDMLQGKNISPGIKQSFSNPETGEFDRDQFIKYLQQVPSLPPNAQLQWELFKRDLKPGRERLKYENLILKTSYITSDEAQREYGAQSNIAEVKYLYVPYYAINDSSISASDSQLKEYYQENKEKYKVDHTRDLKYVPFNVIPSTDDSTFVKEQIADLKEEFRTVKDDSIFAGVNTDGLTFFGEYQIGTLPAQLKANVSNLSIGDVRGPYLEGGEYKLFKISDIYENEEGSAKASHILIKGEDDEAKKEANRIHREIRNGASFEDMARQYSTDGSASKGGDLGWFPRGRMVTEFEEAVFSAKSAGLLPSPIKTQFGYHIIRVDETETKTNYKVSTIERKILPGDETLNEMYRQADQFATSVNGMDEFDAKAQTDARNTIPVANLKPNDRSVGALGDARQIVQWLFRDASEGDVSEVFELDNSYVVAIMTKEVEEGYKDFEDVKTEVTVKVKNELKGQKIIDKLKGLSGSLDEMATAYGADANVYQSSDLKLSSTSLPSVGFDPLAIGKAFSLNSGEKTEPFTAENGVLILEMQNKTEAPEIADYSTYKTQLEQSVRTTSTYNIGEAIKSSADIVDKRYKFY